MTANSQIEMLGNRVDFDCSWGVTGYVLVLTRLITGYQFLHTGVTKIVGESFSVADYLANAPAASSLQDFFTWAAVTSWLPDPTDVMVPQGEFLISLGLIVDTLVRLTAFFDGVLVVFFYLGNAGWGHGVVNGDLFGLVMFVVVGALAAGRILDLGAIIEKMEFVRQRPALKYPLG